MAKEYIERAKAKEELLSWARCIKHPEHLLTEDAMCVLDSIPATDVVEVKHGRWVQVICHEEFEDGFVDRVKECCSVCHAPNWRRTSNYCPNCGARMDGE